LFSAVTIGVRWQRPEALSLDDYGLVAGDEIFCVSSTANNK
jgi:hypothetical protein